MEQTQIEKLREELKKLQTERDKAQLKKGEAAEDNKDLRENSEYDYWVLQEQNLTIRIRRITYEIETLYKKRVGDKT